MEIERHLLEHIADSSEVRCILKIREGVFRLGLDELFITKNAIFYFKQFKCHCDLHHWFRLQRVEMMREYFLNSHAHTHTSHLRFEVCV